MSDVTYRVVVDLSTQGDLGKALDGTQSKLAGLDSSFSKLGSSVSDFGGKLADAFTGAVEKAGQLAMTMGKLGAVAAGAGVTYGVMKLNNELEKTQISLAAIFGAAGQTDNIGDGMKVAAGTMSKMRTDAAALPGEFKDLVGIFKDISVPGFQAGASIDRLRDLSAKTMAVSAVMGLPMEQAGREMAMLLEGRAGAHNVLGMRLAGLGGDKAEKFNKSSAADRLSLVSKELEKFAPAIGVYAKSFDGLSSTLLDNTKKFLGTATLPLFEKVKGTMGGINSWFDGSESKLNTYATLIGDKLAAAWDVGTATVSKWLPAVQSFAQQAYQEIAGIWAKVEPIVARVGDSVRSAFEGGGAVKTIKEVLTAYSAIKMGGMAVSAAGGIGSFASTASKVMGAGSLGGVATEGLAALLNPASLAIAAAGAVILVAGLAELAGAFHVLTDETSSYYSRGIAALDSIKKATDGIYGELSSAWNNLRPTVTELSDSMGIYALESAKRFSGALMTLTMGFGVAAQYAGELEFGIKNLFFDYRGRSTFNDDKGINFKRDASDDKVKEWAGHGRDGRTSPTPPSAPTTNIARVEITIAGNDDPSRVARTVFDKLANMARNPSVSRFVPNYSANR